MIVLLYFSQCKFLKAILAMNAQFHTPSFGDEVFDLTDVEPVQAVELANVNRYNATTNQPNSGDDLKRPKIDAPVKPVSAYGLFFHDTVSAIKAQNSNTSFEDISKIVHSMWEVLDPAHKNVYNKKNELAKKEYIKQMAVYRNSQLNQVIRDETSLNSYDQVNAIQHPNISPKPAQIASRPAVFTITRPGSDPSLMPNDQQAVVAQNNIVYSNSINAQLIQDDMSTNQQPHNMHLVGDAGLVQICIRENCNKRAIINPDWEDEYCSNECVVIHCRNVFNEWVKSNMVPPNDM